VNVIRAGNGINNKTEMFYIRTDEVTE